MVARLSGAMFVVLLVLSLGALVLTSRGGQGFEVKAEFEDAFPLLPGMHVRVNGAVAGTVDETEVTERGTALVTMHLHEGLPRPRPDATAAIRQEDLLGDSYLSLSLGEAEGQLERTIPTTRTSLRPRLDDVMNVFRPHVRAGLEALLVELGIALERRGEDVNTAVVELRPALDATDRVTEELGAQNAALRDLIADSQKVTGQTASRSRDLGRMVNAFAETVRTSAEHSEGIDRGLETMPETLTQARKTLRKLTRTTEAAQPLAASLGEAAPGLTETATLLDPFLDQTTDVTRDLRPTLRRTRHFLDTAEPTFGRLVPGLRALRDYAGPGDDLMDAFVPAAEGVSDSVFGADSGGFGPERFDPRETGLGATSVELGNQPADPFADPARHYNRSVGVLSCESVGFRIEPGCLDRFLAESGAGSAPALPRRSAAGRAGGRAGDHPSSPAPPSPLSSMPELRHLEPELRRRLGEVGPPPPEPVAPPAPQPPPLLDYLLGP